MDIQALAEAIHDSRLSAIVRGSVIGASWVFPTLETVHVLCVALFFGALAAADLRLLGLAAGRQAFTEIYAEVLPLVWWAFGGAVLTGLLMATGRIQDYLSCWQFLMKFACMGLAALNMLAFHFGAFRHVARWDQGRPPAAARVAGLLSLALWVGVIVFGRWIGFVV